MISLVQRNAGIGNAFALSLAFPLPAFASRPTGGNSTVFKAYEVNT
jgi:hypothetical protein